jgi:MtrB/PioB family decaheme-associated outer membrane protein
MSNRKIQLSVATAAVALGLCLLAGPAIAQEPTTPMEKDQQQMSDPPAETTAEEAAGEEADQAFHFWLDPLVIGALKTDVDTGSAKFEEYRDLDSGFVSALGLHGEGGGDRTFDFTATQAGRDDARYTLDYGRTGRYGILFDYNKIPHRFGNGARTLWTQTRPGVYEIANPVQMQLQNAITQQFATNRTGVNFAFLDNLLAPHLAAAQSVDLALQRDRTQARIDFGGLGGFSWALDYKREDRQGNRPYGATFGFNNVTELPEPIDYQTTDAELAGEWNGKRGGLRFGYRYSTFENDVSTLIWDNPFRATDSNDANAYQGPSSSSINGSSRGVADLAPDNEASLLFVDGRTRFGANAWASGSLSYNMMTQDDPLLPYTLNSSIRGIAENGSTFDATDPANLPERTADREVQVLAFNGDAGTRFGDDVTLTFRYRYYDYDNQSKRIEFPGYVRYHAVWEEIGRVTVPYAYTREDLGAELTWDIFRASHLGFAYKRQSWDREFREVESSDEDILTLSFDSKPVQWFNLRASYELGDRSIDGYDPEAQEYSFVHPEGVNNIPTLRKYAQAAREYSQLNVTADFLPADTWSFTVGVTGRDEDYNESAFGLIADEVLQYNAELSYAPGENFNFYLFGHRADREVFQRARQSGATPSTRPIDDWTLEAEEVNDTWGLGLNTKFATRWALDLSGRWTRSDGFADIAATPGGLPLTGRTPTAIDLANYEDIELFALDGRLDYTLTANATAGLIYRYEDYTIDSFILEGLRNYLPGALLLNANNGDYTANLFGFELKFAF